MSVSFYLDWAQDLARDDCDSITASDSLQIQQSPLSAIKNITDADFPDSHKILLSSEPCDINTMVRLLGLSIPIYYQGPIELAMDAQQPLAVVDFDDNSPLLLVARAWQYESVEFLLRCSANLLHQNHDFDNAPQLDIANRYWRCPLALLVNGAALPPGFSAVKIPNTKTELLECIYLRQKYTDMLTQGLIEYVNKAVESQIITPPFRSLDNQSVLEIAFLKQQYEVFVWLKAKRFREFVEEWLFEINSLSSAAKHRIKRAMYKLIYTIDDWCLLLAPQIVA